MILLINLCSEELHYYEFVRPVEKIVEDSGNRYITKKYLELGKKDIEKSDKIIICGTSLNDNNFMKHLSKFEFLKEFKKPVLGICAGLEIIGSVFGAKIIKCTEIGLKIIEFSEEFLSLEEQQEVYLLHNFAVSDLKGFDIYSKTECLQAVKHSEKDIYGVMFHPEARQKKLIVEFVNF